MTVDDSTSWSTKQNIEFDIFIEAIHRFSGHDFSCYSDRSLKRLVCRLMSLQKTESLSSLIPKVMDDEDFRCYVVDNLTVNCSHLFRDPVVFQHLLSDVFSYLRSFPRRSIWIAGCANGEEAYSLAILLKEAGLLKHTHIYATDLSVHALKNAASGVIQSPISADDCQRYRASGGSNELEGYFVTSASGKKLRDELLSHITFEQHNLVQQPEFISAQLVMCRNVFIYFEEEFKIKAMNTLDKSLIPGGYLAMGIKEYINLYESKGRFKWVSRQAGLYRKSLDG